MKGALADHGAKRDQDTESHDEGSGRPWMREHDAEKFVEINDAENGRMESPGSGKPRSPMMMSAIQGGRLAL